MRVRTTIHTPRRKTTTTPHDAPLCHTCISLWAANRGPKEALATHTPRISILRRVVALQIAPFPSLTIRRFALPCNVQLAVLLRNHLDASHARFFELRPRRAVDRTANSATCLQPSVRGVCDRVNLQGCDISLPQTHDAVDRTVHFEPRRAAIFATVRRKGIIDSLEAPGEPAGAKTARLEDSDLGAVVDGLDPLPRLFDCFAVRPGASLMPRGRRSAGVAEREEPLLVHFRPHRCALIV